MIDRQSCYILLAQVKELKSNFIECRNELNKLLNKLDEGLKANGITPYKSDIKEIQQKLMNFQDIITYDVIPEINNKI